MPKFIKKFCLATLLSLGSLLPWVLGYVAAKALFSTFLYLHLQSRIVPPIAAASTASTLEIAHLKINDVERILSGNLLVQNSLSDSNLNHIFEKYSWLRILRFSPPDKELVSLHHYVSEIKGNFEDFDSNSSMSEVAAVDSKIEEIAKYCQPGNCLQSRIYLTSFLTCGVISIGTILLGTYKMKFRTIILSMQAHEIAGMLPGASARGWVCLPESSDLPAAETAIGLVKARAIMFSSDLAILILLICASVFTISAYHIGIDMGTAASSQTTTTDDRSIEIIKFEN